MLVVRHDGSVSDSLVEQLRGPIEEAAAERPGYCEAFVYGLGRPAGEVVVRLTTTHAVVPVLLREREIEGRRVLALVRDALRRADA